MIEPTSMPPLPPPKPALDPHAFDDSVPLFVQRLLRGQFRELLADAERTIMRNRAREQQFGPPQGSVRLYSWLSHNERRKAR